MERAVTNHATFTQIYVRESEGGKGESRKICGYAVLFGKPSSVLSQDNGIEVREMIAPSAITRKFLDTQDIKFTMFHDRHLLLARSNKGKGTLSYKVDSKGVYFEFDAPHTTDGDKAIELVKRGDIKGCSFAFSTEYYNTDYVTRSEGKVETPNGTKKHVTYVVRVITGIYDFTLAADPAYPDTSVSARDRANGNRAIAVAEQVAEMRAQAVQCIDGTARRVNETPKGWRSQVRQMKEAVKGGYV